MVYLFCEIHMNSFFLQWASSSVYYLLGMWSRLVASVPYLKGDSPSLLDEFVPKITEGFIISRFNSVQVYNSTYSKGVPVLICSFSLIFSYLKSTFQASVPDDPTDHPLDKVEVLQDELDCFPYLCRFQVSLFLHMCVMQYPGFARMFCLIMLYLNTIELHLRFLSCSMKELVCI